MNAIALPLVLLLLAADKAPPAPKGQSSAEREFNQVTLAKTAFMNAVIICESPDKCDPGSPKRDPVLIRELADRERDFVTSCRACASEEVCEKDRVRIRAGNGKMSFMPCTPPGAPKGATPAKP